MPGRSRRLISFLVVVGLGTLPVATGAADEAPARARRGLPPDQPGRGLVYRGLRVNPSGPCGEGFEVRLANGRVACTHGPDPAPSGVEVGRPVSTEELRARTQARAPAAPVACIDDGVSGPRVHALYVRAPDVASRFGEVAPMIRGWAGDIEDAFNLSAAETGGTRSVRFVTEPNGGGTCQLTVDEVQLLTNQGDDTVQQTADDLAALGYDRADRKYVAWVDAPVPYCGIALQYYDDRLLQQNANNGAFPQYGRIDQPCWAPGGDGSSVPAHELMHTLGAVQLSAPHATEMGHCTDDFDLMCYDDDDDPGTFPMQTVCDDPAHEPLFDCGDDDYFDTSPDSTEYLATHWNAAMNSFLDGPGVFAPAMPEHMRLADFTRVTPRLVAKGILAVFDDFEACVQDVRVKLQKKVGRRWKNLASTMTSDSGAFKFKLPVESAKYRGLAPRTIVDDEICLQAKTGTLTIRVG